MKKPGLRLRMRSAKRFQNACGIHAMVSMRDVAAFAVGAAVHPAAARNATIVVAGPQAHTWTEVVKIAEDVRSEPIELQYVAAGEPLPGLPEVAGQLAAQFETYETVIDMSDTCARFGIELMTVEAFLRQLLRPTLEA